MKNKIAKRTVCALLCVLLTVSLFSSCSSNSDTVDFIYPFSADVNSYDPQVAATSDEYLIIENTFEGLIRIDDNGKITSGAAESWNISDDGLTYSFTIKKGLKWNINTEKDDNGEFKDERLKMLGYEFNPDITAEDFVFALKRAAEPETQCPLYSSISCIKNAPDVQSGKKDSSKLAVKAKDTYTLEITLSSPDESFMNTLSTAVAMPCNEEFFNATKGRYGLDTEYTLFNGQFYVSQILESSYLLKKNDYYKGSNPTSATELTLKIADSTNSESASDNLVSGYYDAAFISGSEADKIKESSGVTFTAYNDTVWAFAFNASSLLFQNEIMREAFCLGLTRLDDTKVKYLSDADNLIPDSCIVGSKSAGDALGSNVEKQDIAKSVEKWKKGLDLTSNTELTVTIATTKQMQSYVKKMLQGVQNGIGNVTENPSGDTVSVTFKISVIEESKLTSAMSDISYDIVFAPFKSTSSSARAFLSSFADITSAGIDTDSLNKYLSKADASSSDGSVEYIKKAQNTIVGKFCIYPMLYETSYYACANGVTGIQFHPGTGRVNFVNASRK